MSKTVENSVKYDKKLINRTVFAKTYNEPILSNMYTKKFIFGPKINKNYQNQQNENFPKNGIWASLYPLIPTNFMQNMKKYIMSQF